MLSILKKTYSQLNFSQIYLLITILIFSRLIPHPPNFTPIIAAAILCGAIFRNIYFTMITIFLSMFISDLYLGFYSTIFYTYFALFVIAFLFNFNKKKLNYQNTLIYGLVGSIIFFIISNFGVWTTGELYSKNLNGLIQCYFLAIPFFKNTLLSTIFYSYIGLFTAIFMSRFKLKRS